jgi:hypothetical protein
MILSMSQIIHAYLGFLFWFWTLGTFYYNDSAVRHVNNTYYKRVQKLIKCLKIAPFSIKKSAVGRNIFLRDCLIKTFTFFSVIHILATVVPRYLLLKSAFLQL